MNEELEVYLQDKRVGWLRRSTGLAFAYDLDCNPEPLSFCLPIQREEHSNMSSEAYFGGLLPEDPEARQIIARRFNANANDTFSLLKVIGHECAGAVSVVPVNQPVPTEQFSTPVDFLDDDSLEDAIINLPKSPFFIDRGARLSLAGFQGKACVVAVDGKVSVPDSATFSTHILKPDLKDGSGLNRNSVQNEFLCLRLAELLKLPAAKASMGRAKSQVYLLVERFDRVFTNGVLKRIHQEDFCQALGFMPGYKYEADYGPGFEHCFKLIDSFTLSAKDETTFLKYLIFNYLTGNADAHAKNYSVIHKNGGHFLAPLYDTVATTAFPDLSDKMAMSIGGEFQFLKITREHWKKFAVDLALNYKQIRSELIRQAKALPELAGQERKRLKDGNFDTNSLDKTVETISAVCEHTLSIIT